MTSVYDILIICGPTAGGKSARAMEVAAEKDGVIINADSLQVYKALPILTAQPPEEDQSAIPHALYGILEPDEQNSAWAWREKALEEIDRALEAGKTPILVGGTGLYIRTLTEGLSPIPDVPDDIRELAIQRQKEIGSPGLHAELQVKDPKAAARLHPNDTRRLLRAWEVFEATGKPLSEWQKLPAEPPPAHLSFTFEFVDPPRDVLRARCDARFDAMLEMGALEEVETLDARIQAGEVSGQAPVTHALGFHILRDHLHGKLSLEEAAEQAKAETRQYAKRQVTWFRGQLPKTKTS